MRLRALVAALALGCGVPGHVVTPASARALMVHSIEWNPRKEHVGAATGALDLGGDLVLFGERETTILSDGVATTTRGDLRPAGIIPAPDGSGTWLTALDARGVLYRLRARRTFEPVSDRYGLDGKRIAAVTGFGGRWVAFAIGDTGVAIADGAQVVHFDLAGVRALAGGGARAWAARDHDVVELDPVARTMRTYESVSPRVAISSAGRAFVASGAAIYTQSDAGDLALRYVADRDVDALVASSERVWFTSGGDLGVIDGDAVEIARHALAPASRLVASLSGDVWAIDASGAVTRWSRGAAPSTTAPASWDDAVAPVFARACAQCHTRGGASGVDLSNAPAWRTKHDLIRQRVLVDRDMPPNAPLSDADRATLARFLDAR
jgi:hypothetical protein